MAEADAKQAADAEMEVGKPVAPTVDWDDKEMRTSYANVVNASCTREEVALFFGTNMTWNPGEKREFHVRLNDRIVVSPFAAKRLWLLLGAVLKEYETRFGKLGLEGVPGGAGAAAKSAPKQD